MATLRQLEYFVAIAERGHFGRAAAALHVSQPALSHQLRALEVDLGVTLIERGGRQAELTPAGRELVDHARAVLREMEDLTQRAARAADRPLGRIRFGVTPTLGPYLMPGVIEALHRQNPDLRLFIKEGIPALQIAQLADGQLDMMLTPLPVPGELLHVEPLFRERLHIIAPPDHPLAQARTVMPNDLAGTTFLTLDHRHHYHRQVSAMAKRVGAQVLGDYEGTSLDSLRQMVGSGVGLAILPELYMRSEAGGTNMVTRLHVEGQDDYRSIAAVWRRNAAFADVFRMLAELARDKALAILESCPQTPAASQP